MFIELTQEELAQEIWKDIPECVGYLISNMGRVRSKDRIINFKSKKGKDVKLKVKGQLISLRQDKRDKYLRLRIRNNQKRKELSVHRLVAKAFIPNPNNLYTVNHNDENRINNKVSNLCWMSINSNDNYGNRNKNISLSHTKKYRNIKFAQITHNIVVDVFDDITKIKHKYKNAKYPQIFNACMLNKKYLGFNWMIISDKQYNRLSDELKEIKWPKL